MEERREPLAVGTEEQMVTILTEPVAVFTYRGYVPAVSVRVEPTGEEKLLYISAASIAHPLESLRQKNEGRFSGIRIGVKKESSDRFAKYIVREAS
jgi:hypothetical protein